MEAQLQEPQQSAARMQSLMRVVNEQIAGIARDQMPERVVFQDFLCECAHPDCCTRLSLTLTAYDGVRRFPRRFVVLPEHVDARVEDVVQAIGDAVVVEKRGAGGELTARLDPRRLGTGT